MLSFLDFFLVHLTSPFENSKENNQMPGSGHLVIIDS